MKPISGLIVCIVLMVAPVAHAATCTLTGNIKIQPLDSYYCDSSQLGCGGWIETDLDSTTKAMPLMGIVLLDASPPVTWLASTVTSSTGHYSMTWTASSCTRALYMWPLFWRMESTNPTSPIRYAVLDKNGYTHSTVWAIFPTGTPYTSSHTFARTPLEPSDMTKFANVYYIANSAISEIRTWRPSLATAFTGSTQTLYVYYDPTYFGQNHAGPGWGVTVNNFVYNSSMGLRHELGHLVLATLHHGQQNTSCSGYQFGGVDNHWAMSCEWGSTNMDESLASFFGVRSITAADTNVWACGQNDNNDQNHCSEIAVEPVTFDDPDRIRIFPISDGTLQGAFLGIGDVYATTSAQCAQIGPGAGCVECAPYTGCHDCPDMDSDGVCDCTDGNSNGICDDFENNGFRVENNMMRFLWDMIDTNNEGSEDTDESISSFAALIESMSCTSNDLGVDGSCNEPRPWGWCIPASEWGDPPDLPTGMYQTRDSYNPYDFSQLIPGNQAQARRINCVDAVSD